MNYGDKSLVIGLVFFVMVTKEVGCKYKRDHEGMLVYVGDDRDQTFNTPYFDQEMITNYTVQVGHSVSLSCIVRQIGSKTVSWVRKFDSAILSVDDMLVTFDSRINIDKTSYLSDWSLNIRLAEPSDSGMYECQISTEPKKSKLVSLLVTVPTLTIDGSPSILTSVGSNITLKCTVKTGDPPDNLSWFHQHLDGAKYELKQVKNRVIQTGKGSWTLVRVTAESAGNYSCSTHASNTAVVTLDVVDRGGIPEAMLEEELKSYTSSSSIKKIACLLKIYLLLFSFLVFHLLS